MQNNSSGNPFFYVKYDSTGCDNDLSYCQIHYTTTIQTTTTAPSYTTPPTTTTSVGLANFNTGAADILAYPNPVGEVLNIKSDLPDGAIWLEVFDVYGKKQRRVQLCKQEQSVDVNELAPGVYFLQLYKGENLLMTKKIIKE